MIFFLFWKFSLCFPYSHSYIAARAHSFSKVEQWREKKTSAFLHWIWFQKPQPILQKLSEMMSLGSKLRFCVSFQQLKSFIYAYIEFYMNI